MIHKNIRKSLNSCSGLILILVFLVNNSPVFAIHAQEAVPDFNAKAAYINTLLSNARTQALAEDREKLPSVPVHKQLWIGCTNVIFEDLTYTMNDVQKQYFKDVATNFKQTVEEYSEYNVEIQIDVMFIERVVELDYFIGDSGEICMYLNQSKIQAELDIYAPVGKYDSIMTSVATEGTHNIINNQGKDSYQYILGLKTAGFENLYGYSTFLLVEPPSYSYNIPLPTEAPFLATAVAIHEWLHQLEYLGNLLEIKFPPTHSYMGPTEFPGYEKYENDPEYDFCEFYKDVISGNVKFTEGSTEYRIGMFPQMWAITPRTLYMGYFNMKNSETKKYLAVSSNTTVFNDSPYGWHIRYGVDSRWLIYSSNKVNLLDINNMWDVEDNPVNLFVNNPTYPAAQNWSIIANSDGTYKIKTAFNSERVLQGNMTGVATTINTDTSGSNQKWAIVPNQTLGPEIRDITIDDIISVSFYTNQRSVLIIAFYIDSELIGVEIEQVKEEGDGRYKTNIIPSEANKIMVMMWNELETMYPFCNAETKKWNTTTGEWE